MKSRVRIRKVKKGGYVTAFGRRIMIEKPEGTLVKVFRFRDKLSGEMSFGFMKYKGA